MKRRPAFGVCLRRRAMALALLLACGDTAMAGETVTLNFQPSDGMVLTETATREVRETVGGVEQPARIEKRRVVHTYRKNSLGWSIERRLVALDGTRAGQPWQNPAAQALLNLPLTLQILDNGLYWAMDLDEAKMKENLRRLLPDAGQAAPTVALSKPTLASTEQKQWDHRVGSLAGKTLETGRLLPDTSGVLKFGLWIRRTSPREVLLISAITDQSAELDGLDFSTADSLSSPGIQAWFNRPARDVMLRWVILYTMDPETMTIRSVSSRQDTADLDARGVRSRRQELATEIYVPSKER